MANYDSGPITEHPVVSHDEWLRARTALLAKEKAFSATRDQLHRARRALPWERIDVAYLFDTPQGQRSLADLFDGRRQLVVYHFMFAPEWKEGCAHCSFWADSFDSLGAHLHGRDTTFIVVSRAPLAQLDAFRKRMGWRFAWVSSAGNSFNYDFGVSFTPKEMAAGSGFYNYKAHERGPEREGASAFYKDEGGAVFHTYSTYARGIDLLNMTYNVLDLTAKGRDEAHLTSPQAWVRLHDRY